MLNMAKKIGEGLLIAAFLMLVLPFAICAAIYYFGLLRLWLFLIGKLRHDPDVKLQSFIKAPEEDETTQHAEDYFEKLVQAIAESHDIKKYKKSYSSWQVSPEDGGELRNITLRRKVRSKYAVIDFKLDIEEVKNDEYNSYYSSPWDGDDSGLAGNIRVKAKIENGSDVDCEFTISYDQVAAYFCKALLDSGGRYNSLTGQWWSYLKHENVWLVKYTKQLDSNYGVRSVFGNGRARRYWYDKTKI